MSALADIKAALRRTALDGLGDQSRVGTPVPGLILAEIIERIAASILPRQITLRPEQGVALTLLAEGGRLFHLQSADRATDTEVTRCEDATDALRRIVEDGGQIQIRTHPCSLDGTLNTRGVAARDLRHALGLPQSEDTPIGDPLAVLDASLPSGTRIALAASDAGFEILRGESEQVSDLAEWADRMLADLQSDQSAFASALETHGTLRLGYDETQDHHVMIAGRLGQIVVAQVTGPIRSVEALGD